MKILIATDGSDFSEAAVNMVCRIFPELRANSIKVISVYEEQFAVATEPFAISAEYYQHLVDAAEKNAKFFASSAADQLRKAADGELDITEEALPGPPAKVIVEKAESWGADLIVVGSHGRGFWGRMLGSVSDGVLHHAPCSVLVVRK